MKALQRGGSERKFSIGIEANNRWRIEGKLFVNQSEFAKITLEKMRMSIAAEQVREAFFQLPESERDLLLEELQNEGNWELSADEKTELRAIVADSEANPDVGVSWPELRAELQSQVKR